MLLLPDACPKTFSISQVIPAIHAIQRQLKSVDKLKCFILLNEGKAAKGQCDSIFHGTEGRLGRNGGKDLCRVDFSDGQRKSAHLGSG